MKDSERRRRVLATLADVLIIAALAAAATIAWSGGRRFRLGAFGLSMTSPHRALLWSLALAVVRWTSWPHVRPLPLLTASRSRTRADSALPAWPIRFVADATRRVASARHVRVGPIVWRRTSRALQDAARAWPPLAGLSALVIAQPIFGAVARSPEFLVAHEARPADILLVVAGCVLVIPMLFAAVVFLASLASRRGGAIVEDVLVGGLMCALGMQAAKHAGVHSSAIVFILAAAVGIAAAIAYQRFPTARMVATAASLSVLVVPAVFVATPSIRRLIRPPADAGAARPRFADAAARKGTAVPVVLVIFDETPLVSFLDGSRKIDATLYPAFSGLAHDGVLFRNATTVSDYTEWAVPAILSGRYPRAGTAPNAADYPDTLFTLLAGTYRFEVRESVTAVCPWDLCPRPTLPLSTRLLLVANDLSYVYLHAIVPADLESRLPPLTNGWRDFGALGAWRRERVEQQWHQPPGRVIGAIADEFLDRVTANGGAPTLFMLHTLLEHFPHLQLPSGRFNRTRAAVPAFAEGQDWNEDEWAIAQLYQRHLLQLRYVDAYLGRLVDRLRSEGLYDRALIVVTADHGISFTPATSRRSYTDKAAAEIMRVPLIIKFPDGVSARIPSVDVDGEHVNDRNAQTIDILPTIADVLQIALPWRVDGVSLVDAARPEPPAKTMFFGGATKSRQFDRNGPDLSAALQRKLRLFARGGSDDFAPQPDRFRSLLGQATHTLNVDGRGGSVEIAYLSQFRDFHRDDDETAFDVAGRFAGVSPADRQQPTYVAVAVNGIVRAVTHTWASEPLAWQATPPPSVWKDGRNELDVFVVDGTDSEPSLHRCEIRAGAS